MVYGGGCVKDLYASSKCRELVVLNFVFIFCFVYYLSEISLNGETWSVRIHIADPNLLEIEA